MFCNHWVWLKKKKVSFSLTAPIPRNYMHFKCGLSAVQVVSVQQGITPKLKLKNVFGLSKNFCTLTMCQECNTDQLDKKDWKNE